MKLINIIFYQNIPDGLGSGGSDCHVLVLPLIELKSHFRSLDPCETDNSMSW